MPLVRIDVIKGRSSAEIECLLDAAHRAVVGAFGVPERDRYQVLTEHEPTRIRIEDTGLGIARSAQVVLISVTSRPRARDAKLAFYRLLCDELQSACSIGAHDVVVNVVTNTDEDWSFGLARAQFLTGDL
jgi:hypothetical protein